MGFGDILGPIAQTLAPLANVFMQQENNLKSEQAATRQMQFQQTMSDTSHQREVKDLKAAGLNPILSANAGASSPGGAQPTLTAPQVQMPDFMAYGISLKQLEQAKERLQFDKTMGAASMAKTLDEQDILKMQKILLKTGMPKAHLNEKIDQLLQKLLNSATTNVKSPNFKSMGGELQPLD